MELKEQVLEIIQANPPIRLEEIYKEINREVYDALVELIDEGKIYETRVNYFQAV